MHRHAFGSKIILARKCPTSTSVVILRSTPFQEDSWLLWSWAWHSLMQLLSSLTFTKAMIQISDQTPFLIALVLMIIWLLLTTSTLDWLLVLGCRVKRHSSTTLKSSGGLHSWLQKMIKARQQKHYYHCMIVQSKTLKNFIHFKKNTETIMKLWRQMELLFNVLIGINLSWLLDQEICKILNSCLWIARLNYIKFYLNSKV